MRDLMLVASAFRRKTRKLRFETASTCLRRAGSHGTDAWCPEPSIRFPHQERARHRSAEQLNAVTDVAVTDGKIAGVAANIDPRSRGASPDASGLVVMPGLIDIHAHVFSGTEKDEYDQRRLGATARRPLVAQRPDHAQRRRQRGLAKLPGVQGSRHRPPAHPRAVIPQHRRRRDGGERVERPGRHGRQADRAAHLKHPGVIVGIKSAHYGGPEWDPSRSGGWPPAKKPSSGDDRLRRERPPRPLDDLLTKHFRPGDILTHIYGRVRGRIPIGDEEGPVRAYVARSRKPGAMFDAGHGGRSFRYRRRFRPLNRASFPT